MRIILLSIIALSLTACMQEVKNVKDIGCVLITEESRAEIREGQKIKTNICQDDLSK